VWIRLCLRRMEEGRGIICAGVLLENRILNDGKRAGGYDGGSMKSAADDLKFVLCAAFRVVLVLLFFLLHLLHHVAAAVTMHLGTALVHAKVFGNILPVQLVFSYDHGFAEGLHQHAKE